MGRREADLCRVGLHALSKTKIPSYLLPKEISRHFFGDKRLTPKDDALEFAMSWEEICGHSLTSTLQKVGGKPTYFLFDLKLLDLYLQVSCSI